MRKRLLSVALGAMIVIGGCHAEMSVESPAAVRDAFRRDHPGATVNGVQESNKNGGTHYEYKYTDSTGNKKTAEYDAQGNAGSEGGR